MCLCGVLCFAEGDALCCHVLAFIADLQCVCPCRMRAKAFKLVLVGGIHTAALLLAVGSGMLFAANWSQVLAQILIYKFFQLVPSVVPIFDLQIAASWLRSC
ncbi:hypothetical protein U1Q18_049234 [Sarracenia purpurea var. burkii]